MGEEEQPLQEGEGEGEEGAVAPACSGSRGQSRERSRGAEVVLDQRQIWDTVGIRSLPWTANKEGVEGILRPFSEWTE